MGLETADVVVAHEDDHAKVSLDFAAVLRESVSFGRYVSESLDWGKWSSFSQNRNLEDAEKYSTRGSVAQKKAYFEEHYKKIAAKKAAALLEQAAAQENDNFGQEDDSTCLPNVDEESALIESSTVDELDVDEPNLDEESAFIESSTVDMLVIDEPKVQPEFSDDVIDVPTVEADIDGTNIPLVPFDDNSCAPEETVLDAEDVEKYETWFRDEETPLKKGSPLAVDDVENQINDFQVESGRDGGPQKSPLMESCISNQEVLVPSDMKRKSPVFGSYYLKKSQRTLMSSAESVVPIAHTKENMLTTNSRNSIKLPKGKPRASRASPTNAHRKEETIQPVSKPSTSVNVWNAKSSFSCFKSFQDVAHSNRTPTRKTVSPSSKLTKASPSPRSDKRSKTSAEKQKNESQLTDVKWPSLVFTSERSSSSGRRKSNVTQSVSSFCFWNGERAERRKEYITKLEEKLNAQKLEREAKAKEKAENELKLLRQSLGFKARPLPAFYNKIESPKTEINKSPSKRSIFGWKRNSVDISMLQSSPSKNNRP